MEPHEERKLLRNADETNMHPFWKRRKQMFEQEERDAEARLAAAGAAERQQMLDDDPFGVGVALFNMRAMAEDAAEELEERQINQAMLVERRQEEQRARQRRIFRRQDYYEQRRRGVAAVLRRQLGREPHNDEFIAAVSHLKVHDLNWSDDEQ